jgi:chemosensory pili system protein ChpA (sensor histidine kinase/response regulator)
LLVLTSRTGEKHRQKALDLGATDYIVKPYQDALLLEAIRDSARSSRERATA